MGGNDLAVEVGDVYRIVIDEVERPHAASRQGFHAVAPHAADAKNRHPRPGQTLHGFFAKEQGGARKFLMHGHSPAP